jgi:hypothetical protein
MFADAVGGLPVPWEISTTQKQYSASIESYEIGPVNMGRVAFDPFQAAYACNRVESEDRLCLTMQISGCQRMIWSDQATKIGPGDLVMWSNTRAMWLDNREPGNSYNIWLPMRVAERRVGDVSALVRRKLGKGAGVAQILASNVRSLFEHLGDIPERARMPMVNATLDRNRCFQATAIQGMSSPTLLAG